MISRPPPNGEQTFDEAKFAEIKSMIHPLAKAVPSLCQQVEAILETARVGRLRHWRDHHKFHKWILKWRNSDTGEKPDLESFLAVLATFDSTFRDGSCVFKTFVERRKLREWAENEIRARAMREGIELSGLLPKEPLEEETATKRAVEPEARVLPPQLTHQEHPGPPHQGTPKPSTQNPGPDLPQNSPATRAQKAVFTRSQQSVPKPGAQHAPTLRQQTLTKSTQQSTPKAAQKSPKPPSGPSHASPMNPMYCRDDGSVLPLKRSIECPAGAECPSITKRVRTNDVGCQAGPKGIDFHNETKIPQESHPLLPAPTHQVETQSNTPQQQRADSHGADIITAVEKLVQSNTEMQKSNSALQQSFQSSMREMAAQGMYWQQQATMMPPPNYYYQVPEYGMMMMPPGRAGGFGFPRYPPPQRPAAVGEMGRDGRMSDLQERRDLANEGRRNLNSSKGQSRYFGVRE